MLLFRLFVAVLLISILAYTGVVVFQHGMNLVPVFVGGLLSWTWQGQFNLDFMCYLLLSALWVAWRHEFSSGGVMLALIASVGGMIFLGIYLLIVTAGPNMTFEKLALGKRYQAAA